MGEEERNLTLDEWMDRLSVNHRAHMEYAQLNDQLTREREKVEQLTGDLRAAVSDYNDARQAMLRERAALRREREWREKALEALENYARIGPDGDIARAVLAAAEELDD